MNRVWILDEGAIQQVDHECHTTPRDE